jgi:hypothetical protein
MISYKELVEIFKRNKDILEKLPREDYQNLSDVIILKEREEEIEEEIEKLEKLESKINDLKEVVNELEDIL